jgi:hypothetical protein
MHLKTQDGIAFPKLDSLSQWIGSLTITILDILFLQNPALSQCPHEFLPAIATVL